MTLNCETIHDTTSDTTHVTNLGQYTQHYPRRLYKTVTWYTTCDTNL